MAGKKELNVDSLGRRRRPRKKTSFSISCPLELILDLERISAEIDAKNSSVVAVEAIQKFVDAYKRKKARAQKIAAQEA